jgi:hypothetical protein
LGIGARKSNVASHSPCTEPFSAYSDNAGTTVALTKSELVFNQTFGQRVFFDLALSYTFAVRAGANPGNVRATIGAENLLDTYPDKARFPNTLADARLARSRPTAASIRASALRGRWRTLLCSGGL